jgi:hypothetical protein
LISVSILAFFFSFQIYSKFSYIAQNIVDFATLLKEWNPTGRSCEVPWSLLLHQVGAPVPSGQTYIGHHTDSYLIPHTMHFYKNYKINKNRENQQGKYRDWVVLARKDRNEKYRFVTGSKHFKIYLDQVQQ